MDSKQCSRSLSVETNKPNSSEDSPPWLQWLSKLDSFGVESRGIERVTPKERMRFAAEKRHSKASQFLQVIGLWFAACGGLTTMSSFFLPRLLYGLSYRDSMISGIISMNIGCLVPAYTATMGAKSGLRQMVSSRFLFGWWGVRFVALICIVGGIGWSVVNCVFGGQVLAAISDGKLLLSVGIVIISLVSLVVAVFGIKVLLKFQTILSVPITIAVILFYIVVCKKREYLSVSDSTSVDSLTNTGNWLSFFTLGYAVTATWGSGASDYYILLPENTPSYQVFLLTFFGIAIPSTIVAVAGVLCGSIAYEYEPWNQAYQEYGNGSLLDAAFKPWGIFGKIVVVILYISLVCNNIMNTYSCAFEFQLIDKSFAKIPRWIWAFGLTIVYLVISLCGKLHLSTIISNFLPMLGYWISIYITILLEENILFRSFDCAKRLHHAEFENQNDLEEKIAWTKDLYNWEQWDDSRYLTLGLAATGSFVFGIAGAVLGMNQVYFRGPVAKKIGQDGGDVGFWLSMAFSGVAYPIFRYLELKKFGK